MSEPIAEKVDTPIEAFRRSVGFQFMFVLHSGMAVGRAIDHLCASAERFRAASNGWQPIESAPKDGTRILAVIAGSDEDDLRVRVVQWGKTSHVPMYGFCLADQGVENFDLCEPLWWMPVPDPPETNGKQGQE